MTEKEPIGESNDQSNPELKGDLIEKMRERKKDEEFLLGLVLIQRDSGSEWTVKRLQYEKDKITLTNGKAVLTIRISKLKKDLEIEGSPWSAKK